MYFCCLALKLDFVITPLCHKEEKSKLLDLIPSNYNLVIPTQLLGILLLVYRKQSKSQ